MNTVVRQNVIFQRAKFNRRRQEDGKTVDTFITALHTLAEHCDYGTLKDEMIRDRIVVGLQDSKLSEKLQLGLELSLAKAINHSRQSEAVKKQQALLRTDFKDSEGGKKNVDAVKVTRKNPPKLKDEKGPKPKKPPLKKLPSQPSNAAEISRLTRERTAQLKMQLVSSAQREATEELSVSQCKVSRTFHWTWKTSRS